MLALGSAWQIARAGINQDVRYVLGVLASGEFSWTQVWAHRPLASRAVMALSELTWAGSETLWRLWATLVALAAAGVLFAGLRRVIEKQTAALISVAVATALAWAPGWDFGEPEWFASVFAAAAVGLALVGRTPDRPTSPAARFTAVGAGMLLALVCLLKYTTTVTAVLALVALWLLSRSTARSVALVTVAAGATGLVLSVTFTDREGQWLADMPALNQRPTISAKTLAALLEGFTNSLVTSPMTLVASLAIVVLLRHGHRRAGAVSAAALAWTTVPFIVQQQGFLYHLAALPVVASVVVVWTLTRPGLAGWALPFTAAAAGLAGAALFLQPAARRDGLWLFALGLLLVVWVAGFLIDLGVRRTATPLLLLACLLPLTVTMSPGTAYSYSLAHSRVTSGANRARQGDAKAQAERVRAVLPTDAQVVYFSFDHPYSLRYSTPCRYVSPTFLQRATGTRATQIMATQSFAENLECVGDPKAAYAVIDPTWFKQDANPTVQQAVEANFDCGRPVLTEPDLVICPRR